MLLYNSQRGPQPNHILYVEKTVYQVPYVGNTIFTRASSVYVKHTCNGDSGGPLFCRGNYIRMSFIDLSTHGCLHENGQTDGIVF